MGKPIFFRRPFKYVYFNATLIIIAINILVFVLTSLFRNLDKYLALSPIFIIYFKYFYQFVTYMFTHANFRHLLFNMLGLLFFGIPLERRLGSKEFLLFYFVCGILSGVLSFVVYIISHSYYTFLLGASGVVYGILFAYAVAFPRSTIFIWGIIPVPAPILVLIYAIIEIGSEFWGKSNVAHLTHLFGFLVAWIYFLLRMRIRPIKIWIDAFKN